jgi:hypothetical protein
MNWTPEDEAKLKELTERKAHTVKMNRDCLERAVNRKYYLDMPLVDVLDALIKDATVLRKVLAPFDKELK